MKLLDSPDSVKFGKALVRRSKSEEPPVRPTRMVSARASKKKLIDALEYDKEDDFRSSIGHTSVSSRSKLQCRHVSRQGSGESSRSSGRQEVRRNISAGVELEALRQAAVRKGSGASDGNEHTFLSPLMGTRALVALGSSSKAAKTPRTPKISRSKSLALIIESSSPSEIAAADMENVSMSPATNASSQFAKFPSLQREEPMLRNFDFSSSHDPF